jgi:hypothetical protein
MIVHLLFLICLLLFLQKLNRLCLNLVKGLAGNDDVKARIVKQGIAPLIVSAMHQHEVCIKESLSYPYFVFIYTSCKVIQCGKTAFVFLHCQDTKCV